ncbi:MAG: Trk system potassium transporter TrkA [Bacteroidota bacterium]
MKIVIAGAGEVGFHIAQLLSSEAQNIVLIDTNQDVLDYAQSHIDVLTLKGDSTSIRTLLEANVKKADLLIAVTSSGNANIVTAVIGKRLGVAKTIARINKNEYLAEGIRADFEKIGIDSLISPKLLAAKEIYRLIHEAALTDIYEFENGKLFLIGMTLEENSPVIDQTIINTIHLNPDFTFKPIAIQRGSETIIPRGSTHLRINDHIYFITQNSGIDSIEKIMGKEKREMKKIMIFGGSSIGILSAQQLEKEYQVKLIEINKDKCLELAERLNKTLVINGDGSNVELLEEEGLSNMDAFVALTEDSGKNIISCLVAKRHNVYKTIALVDNIDYIPLSQTIGVDTLINRKLIAANEIFRYVRKGRVKAVTSLHGVNAEIIEYEVSDRARITRYQIKNSNFPKGAVIGGVIRGEKSYIPFGDFHILAGDKVVVFTLPEELKNVAKFFK